MIKNLLSGDNSQNWKGRILLPTLVIIAALILVMLMMATKPELGIAVVERDAVAIRVVTVQPAAHQLTVKSQGTVMPRVEASLIAEVAGIIDEVSPNMIPGGRFKQGDILVKLDDRDHTNHLTSAQAAVTRAEAQLIFSKSEYQRIDSLKSRDLTSQSQAQNALSALKVAEANLLDAKAALARAELDLTRTVIRAPFDGRILKENVDAGQLVQRGGVLGTLYADDYVEVRLPISDDQLAFLDSSLSSTGEVADDVTIDVVLQTRYAGREIEWHGRLLRTEAEIDARSRLINLVALVDNQLAETPLPIGLFVKATIQGIRADNVVALPREAIRDGNRVLVVENNTIHYRNVSILRMDHEQVLINGGLNDGEMVCLSNLQTVVEGMAVTVFSEGA